MHVHEVRIRRLHQSQLRAQHFHHIQRRAFGGIERNVQRHAIGQAAGGQVFIQQRLQRLVAQPACGGGFDVIRLRQQPKQLRQVGLERLQPSHRQLGQARHRLGHSAHFHGHRPQRSQRSQRRQQRPQHGGSHAERSQHRDVGGHMGGHAFGRPRFVGL